MFAFWFSCTAEETASIRNPENELHDEEQFEDIYINTVTTTPSTSSGTFSPTPIISRTRDPQHDEKCSGDCKGNYCLLCILYTMLQVRLT